MILPLYANACRKIGCFRLLEAANDLGASPGQRRFWLVTFSAVAARRRRQAALLCFIPIVGEFVIPDLLAGSNSMM